MISNRFLKAAALTALLASSVTAHAATIFNVTGPTPFGFVNQSPAAEGWSQASTYTNVSITIPLADLSAGGPIPGVQGTVYLVNQIGPGTTAANNVAPPVQVSGLTASFTPQVLFSGLTLGPGNYYVVWVSTSLNDLSMSMEGSSTATSTLGSGVTELGNSSSLLVPAAFPPATSDLLPVSAPGNFFITVSGTPAATPVPTLASGNMIALTILLALLGMFVLRRWHWLPRWRN